MVLNRTMGMVRLGLGFLIAPAILPVLVGTLVVAARGGDIGCPVLLPNFLCAIVALPYACAVVFGLPWVLWMRRRGELNLRTIMAPILGLALPLLVLLSVAASMVSWSAGGMTALSLPGLILSALCFYFVAIWRPAGAALHRT